jgi:hypothetical protein
MGPATNLPFPACETGAGDEGALLKTTAAPVEPPSLSGVLRSAPPPDELTEIEGRLDALEDRVTEFEDRPPLWS